MSLVEEKELFKTSDSSAVQMAGFLVGMFVTMPIVTLPIGGRLLSIFSLVFYAFILMLALSAVQSRKSLRSNGIIKALFLFFLISFLSSMVGVLFFLGEGEWVEAILNYVPKIFIYALLLLLLLRINNSYPIVEKISKGFIFGCILNLAWSVIESLYFYTFSSPLNDVLFAGFIDTLPEDRKYLTVIKGGIIRASGFNYDPAHLGGIVPIVFLYAVIRKKLALLVLAVASLVFSASTTALVATVMGLLVSVGRLGVVSSSDNRSKGLKIVFFMILSVVLLLALSVGGKIKTSDDILINSGFKNNFTGFVDRVSKKSFGDKYNPSLRHVYYAYIPEAISFNGFLVLTGTGFGTSSYPYVSPASEISKYVKKRFYPYDPESTYVSYLFDIGIFGLGVYLFILFKSYSYYRKKISMRKDIDVIMYSALCGIVFSGLFYHYTLTAYQVILLILSAVLTLQKKRIQPINNLRIST